MKILNIIHGYPPRYNAGSEVYTQMLCQALSKRHEVHVFTRQENSFLPDYVISTEKDEQNPDIQLHIINLVSERYRYQYRHVNLDEKLDTLLKELKPDIVHIGHLNHLSTSVIHKIYQHKIPIVFTLHDYWLMCPRGQFMQRLGKTPEELWPVCEGQNDRKCALHCYAGAVSGNPNTQQTEIAYWENWVTQRMQHIHEISALVDYFIAPSRYLYQRFIEDFSLSAHKMTFLDYGFDLERITAPLSKRVPQEVFTFGYIGTHIPAKGIHDLIRAFNVVEGFCQLRIWGKFQANTAALQAIVKTLPLEKQQAITWEGEYINNDIINTVFNHTDCIVVPSIWVENSPLVIHEALQARVPVITADVGGMAEHISHQVNGLLFKHRDIQSLTKQMQYAVDFPEKLNQFSQHGYLYSADGQVIGMEAHANKIEKFYHFVLDGRKQ